MTREEPEVTSNPSEIDEETPAVSPKLKFLVIGQGIAILILIVVIIGTLAYRAMKYVMAEPQETVISTSLPEQENVLLTPIQEATPPLPKEFVLETNEVYWGTFSMKTPNGSKYNKLYVEDDVIILEFLHEDGGVTLMQVSKRSGKKLGDIYITPSK